MWYGSPNLYPRSDLAWVRNPLKLLSCKVLIPDFCISVHSICHLCCPLLSTPHNASTDCHSLLFRFCNVTCFLLLSKSDHYLWNIIANKNIRKKIYIQSRKCTESVNRHDLTNKIKTYALDQEWCGISRVYLSNWVKLFCSSASCML